MHASWGEPSHDGLGVRRYLIRLAGGGLIKIFDRPSSYVEAAERFMIELLREQELVDVQFAASRTQAERNVRRMVREHGG